MIVFGWKAGGLFGETSPAFGKRPRSFHACIKVFLQTHKGRGDSDYVVVTKILKLTDTEFVLINLTPDFTTTGKVTKDLKTDMGF